VGVATGCYCAAVSHPTRRAARALVASGACALLARTCATRLLEHERVRLMA